MSCIGNAFCPECREIIYGNGCMCGLACDRGNPRHSCTMDAPDGIWPKRQYGQPAPTSLCETKNGWQVRWKQTDGEWSEYREPFDATKSPSQLRWESIKPLPMNEGYLAQFKDMWPPGQTGILIRVQPDNDYLTTGAGI